MALTLLTNSYLANAEGYLLDNPYWEAASSEVQEQALVDATKLLDQNEWLGTAVTSSQPLAWPRTKLSFLDPVLNLYVPCEQGEVPNRVQKATAYLALHLVKYPDLQKGFEATFDVIEVGPIKLENKDVSSSPGKIPLVPAEITKLIAPLLSNQGAIVSSGWWRAN